MALALASLACGYDTSATFHADGSVTVALKFLLPSTLLQEGSGVSMQGFSQADIDRANAELAAKYAGGKIVQITEGDESGVLLTIPFKTEKDAFAFLTEPSTLSPSGATSGGGSSIDVGNTGGLFVSATHTRSGQTDRYTFKTQASPLGSLARITASAERRRAVGNSQHHVLADRPQRDHVPGALFTLDRRTAIWKLSLTQPQTLTATTESGFTLAGSASNGVLSQSPVLFTGLGLAIALGFILGMFTAWRIRRGPEVVPATTPPSPPPNPPTG